MDNALSLPAAATRLRRTWHSAYSLLLKGELGPVERLGRGYVVSAAGVEAFLERERAAKHRERDRAS